MRDLRDFFPDWLKLFSADGRKGIAEYLLNGIALCAVSFFIISGFYEISAADLKLESAVFSLGNGFKNNSWNTLHASVVNDDSEGCYADLVFDLSGDNRALIKARYSKKVWLPGYSRRLVEMVVYLAYREDSIDKLFKKNRKTGYAYKEHNVTYADGSSRIVKTPPIAKPFKIKVQLYTGVPAVKAGEYEIFAIPFFPGTAVVLEGVIQVSVPEVSTLYNAESLEYIYGEYDSDYDSNNVYDLNTLYERGNYPRDESILIDRTVNLSRLPSGFTGLNPADVLFISDIVAEDGEVILDHAQRQALLSWVSSGGNIVFVPGYEKYLFADSFLSKLLPAVIVERKTVEKKDAGTLLGGGARGAGLKGNYFLEALRTENARDILADRNNLFMSAKDIAAGRSWFISMNGRALSKAAQNTGIFRHILQARPGLLPGKDGIVIKKVPQLMQKIIGVTAPDRKFMVILLGSYALLCIIMLFALRLKGRAELAWPIIVVFSFAAFAVAVLQGSRAREETGFATGQIEISQLSKEGHVSSSSNYYALFSPQSFTSDSVMKRDNSHILPYYDKNNKSWKPAHGDVVAVADEDSLFIRDLIVKGGELFTCQTESSSLNAKGVDLQVEFTEKGIGGTLVNKSGIDLKDCLVVINRRVLRAGDLKASAAVKLADLSHAENGEFSNSDFITDERARLRSNLLALARKYPKKYFAASQKNRVYGWPLSFYGWAEGSESVFAVNQDKVPKSRSLRLLAAEPVRVSSRQNIRLEKGVCSIVLKGYQARRFFGDREYNAQPKTSFRSTSTSRKKKRGKRAVKKSTAVKFEPKKEKTALSVTPTGWLESEGPAKFEVTFELPEQVAGFKAKEAWVIFNMKKRDIDVELSVMDRKTKKKSRKWIVLDWEKTSRIKLKNLNKLFGDNGELPVFQVKVGMSKGSKGGGLSGMSKWRVSELDIELLGTTGSKGGKK
ncbi:MAG: hypothetical protein ACYTFY_10035 [Planctomycetota bacterium]|jgi:hypothetical protein